MVFVLGLMRNRSKHACCSQDPKTVGSRRESFIAINAIRYRNFHGLWSPWGAGWDTSELLKRRAMSRTYFFLLCVI